ncbi:hypothetical protein ACFV3Q_33075, partial [Streptomyces mexicanus]
GVPLVASGGGGVVWVVLGGGGAPRPPPAPAPPPRGPPPPPTAELGSTLGLRVRVSLGSLSPDDVEVQAVSGRVDEEDRITDATAVPLKPTGEAGPDGHWVYEGPLGLDRTGPYGYTVRVLPAHRLLASPAELGLVTVPAQEAGEGAGVLLR